MWGSSFWTEFRITLVAAWRHLGASDTPWLWNRPVLVSQAFLSSKSKNRSASSDFFTEQAWANAACPKVSLGYIKVS